MTPLMSPHHPVQTRSLCLHSYMITGKHRNNNIIPRTPKKKFILKLENMLSMRETKWYIFSRFQFKVFFSFSKPTQIHLPVLVSICVICDIITGKISLTCLQYHRARVRPDLIYPDHKLVWVFHFSSVPRCSYEVKCFIQGQLKITGKQLTA